MNKAVTALAMLTTALLGGCYNGDNDTIHLGDVSLGQQMMDLQAAVERGALTEDEYRRVKALLLSAVDEEPDCSGSEAGGETGSGESASE